MDTIRIDLRARQIETRQIRDGVAMLSQGRTNIINLDGSIEYGEWFTTGIITNYGDVYDKKPSLFERFLTFWRL